MNAPHRIGAPNAAERSEMGLAPCVVCKEWKDEAEGEPQPFGEQVCADCMSTVIECPNCEGWFKRAEFVKPDGLDTICAECAHAKDLWEQMRGAQP